MNEELKKAFFNEISKMDINALQERLAALDVEVRALEDVSEIELRAEQKKLINERITELKEQEARAKKAEEINAGAPAVIIERKTEEKMDNVNYRASKEYINAFANYLKTGNEEECRAILSTNAVTGGIIPVPEFVDPIIKNAWEKTGLMDLVKKTYIKGNVKIGFEISATGAVIHKEGSEELVPEQVLTIGVKELKAESIKKWVTVSDEVLDLSAEDFIYYVYDELTYHIAKKAEEVLVDAIVNSEPTSTADNPAVGRVAGAPGYGTIAAAIGALSDQAARPVVVMNKATWAAFKAAQYEGNFAADIFEGLPVYFNNKLPVYSAAEAGAAYAIVGDFGIGAQANYPAGVDISIKVDELSLAEKDLVKFVGREFVGIGVVAPFAFTLITK